jgi:hypothetical protein
MEPEDVSLAWEYLFSLPNQQEPTPPPEHLQSLSDSDWFLLNNLLAREMRSKAQSSLH